MKLEDMLKKPTSNVDDVIVDEPSLPSMDDIINNTDIHHKDLPDYLINDTEVVGYPDEEMQDEIYDWVLNATDDRQSIKDYGCGRGDINGGNDFYFYLGIDKNPIMIRAGKQKWPDVNIIHDDYLNVDTVTDHTVCVGTLNVDHGYDKWEYFSKTLDKGLETSTKSVIFILARKMELEGFLDYPFDELFQHLPENLRFEIDYTKFEDIYRLIVYKDGYHL